LWRSAKRHGRETESDEDQSAGPGYFTGAKDGIVNPSRA
jgi:hypothetical protein